MSVFMTVALHYLCGGQHDFAPPWLDGQKWAESTFPNPPFNLADGPAEHSLLLSPVYGSAAAMYRVDLTSADGTSPHWRYARVQLTVNAETFGPPMPIAWYVGCATDLPTGIVRFQESYGPRPYGAQHELPAGVWALSFRRSA